MGVFTSLVGFAAPAFLILSPVFSYTDQALAMHRNKTSAGFSLDIPLIMLVASMFRVFYWPGERYDTALLVQSFIMIVIQSAVLKIALDNRPGYAGKGGEAGLPFAGEKDGQAAGMRRPYNFWQWRSPRPYWHFLLWMFICLAALELLLASRPSIYPTYSSLVGYIGLTVEATLPLPQLIANARSRSCKGFRSSVLVSWVLGDAMKMFWFFTSTSPIPWAFKTCGIFQAACDLMLGVQYFTYGDKGPSSSVTQPAWPYSGPNPHMGGPNGRLAAVGRRTPLGGKTF